MSSAGFESAIPEFMQMQTYALDRTATGKCVDLFNLSYIIFFYLSLAPFNIFFADVEGYCCI